MVKIKADATVALTPQEVIRSYKSADEDGKSLLSKIFGEEFFNVDVTKTIKSFEDACESLGIDAKTATPDIPQSRDSGAIIAFAKLSIIARALNEGWEPDWTNSRQRKHYPWFKVSSGSGLSYDDYAFTRTSVGSRLVFKTEELARYAGQQFLDIYNEFITIK